MLLLLKLTVLQKLSMLVPKEPSKVPHNPPPNPLELVIILTILAIQRGRAEGAEPHPVHRSPNLPPEGLHVPGVGLGIVDLEEALVAIEYRVQVKLIGRAKEVMPATGAFMRVLAKDTET